MTRLAVTACGHQVQIGECRLDTDQDVKLSVARSDLNAEERARAAAFVFDRDRERFVRARGYLRRELGRFIGVPAARVPIRAEPGGKPYLEQSDVGFSLSHSGSHAVLAIRPQGDVGIDLESADRSDRLADQIDGLARLCLTPEEQDALAGVTASQRAQRFLSYWTAKEARMKLTGEGLTLEPHAISLELTDGLAVGYRRPRHPAASLQFLSLSQPDAICCLAVRADAPAVMEA